MFNPLSEYIHPHVLIAEPTLATLSSRHIAGSAAKAKQTKAPFERSSASVCEILTSILKKKSIRIYGINDSWGSYLYVHFKNGKTRELWVGHQCRSPYIELSREEYNQITIIKWQQGTRFSYDYPKPYSPPQDPSTIFALFINNHGIKTLRGSNPDELRDSIMHYGETVLLGHTRTLTPATWHHGADAVISELEDLANNPVLKRIAPRAEIEARHWHREGHYVKRLYN